MKRHQKDTKTFEELTFSQQAKSINISILNLERSIVAHTRRAREEDGRCGEAVRRKCRDQVKRLGRQI